MSIQSIERPPQRTEKHDALEIFLGSWRAEGQSFGVEDQSTAGSTASPKNWVSSHVAEWHSGKFFVFQSESAFIGDKRSAFNTLSILGVEEKSETYFVRTFDNFGYHRQYSMTADGNCWRIKGDTERALIEFSDDGAKQTIHWDWRPMGEWLTLCDRIATKIEL